MIQTIVKDSFQNLPVILHLPYHTKPISLHQLPNVTQVNITATLPLLCKYNSLDQLSSSVDFGHLLFSFSVPFFSLKYFQWSFSFIQKISFKNYLDHIMTPCPTVFSLLKSLFLSHPKQKAFIFSLLQMHFTFILL